jgi:uncharacterized protein (DUF3820 family)
MITTGGDRPPVNTPHASPNSPARCHRCGSAEVVITRCETGPHFARVRCPGCGRTGFAKTPWSLDRARAFTMPWGRYRGRQLADLTGTDEGLGYLRWLADAVEGNVSTAARILLDHASQTSSDGPSSLNKKPCGVQPPHGLSATNTPFSDPEGVRHE